MLHTNRRFHETVEQAVAAIEEETNAELVVVAAPRSGTYRDVSLIAGSALTWVLIIVLLFIDQAIHPVAFMLEIALAWIFCGWLADADVLLRLVVPGARQQEQVRRAAATEFHQEAVHSTPDRTGVLVYVSALEGIVEVVPDVGIEARIPAGRWAEATREFSHDDLDHFVKGLHEVGVLLAEAIPATDDNTFDLPNAPRVR